jgi:predicted secreted Zn-dependent protease
MIVKVPSATRVRYFDVVGATPRQLLRQTIRVSRRSCGGKDALACVNLKTRVGQARTRVDRRTGACTFASVDITLSATVYVPRWTKPARVPAALVEWWRQELERSALHEEQHIFIQQGRIDLLERELSGAPCDAGKAIVRRWSRETQRAQEAFDAREMEREPIPWPELPAGRD